MPSVNDHTPPEISLRYAHSLDVMDTDGALEVHRSSIETSRKTIRMQIADLYSDKPGSIVREITANAFDSHLRAGQTRPFYVHAPTTLVPEFFVRDYGVGMTAEVMKEVYIVIGKSDKDKSDDEVGMWGLGSKSPFAYADQYTITCFDGVEARHYGYGIAEDGVPDLYLMAVEPNDEPAGVRIGLSVETKDFELFAEAVRFNVVAHDGGFEHNLGEVARGTKDLIGAGWSAYSESPLKAQGYSGTSWWARQGCVLYRIDDNQLTLPRETRHGHKRAWIIDCPIGMIKMTPSREAIQYDAEVVDYLKARIAALVEEVRDSVWQAVKDVESVVEFFATIDKIKPEFVVGDFVHPITKLKSPHLKSAYPNVFFQATQDERQQWTFAMPETLDLKTAFNKRIFILDDVRPLLDPSRTEDEGKGLTKWLSRSEVRRISRFTRAYMEKREIKNGLFMMNLDWNDEFLAAIFPKAEGTTRVSFDDLRGAVPRRVAPPVEKSTPPIRGLALAKAAGEQKPVFSLEPEVGSIAWVSSDQYRRQSSALFKLGKAFDVTALYIAAPGDAQARVKAAGFPHMAEAIATRMAADGLTLGDWHFMRTTFRANYYNTGFIEWLRHLLSKNPKAYTRLAQGKGAYSTIAKGLKRTLKSTRVKLTDEDEKALETLLMDDSGKKIEPPTPTDLKPVKVAHDTLESSYNNPTVKFVDGLPRSTDATALDAFVDAILHLQAAIPPNKKYS